MELTQKSINDRQQWLDKGYRLPEYDRETMIRNTREHPVWVHFGAGNIFRAFQAAAAQRMLNKGLMNSGITAVDGYDYEIILKNYRPHDDLSIAVTLKADGSIAREVIGSIGESCILDSDNEAEYSRLKQIFTSDSLQLASFTITEKGYSLVNSRGEELPAVSADLQNGPHKPVSYLGKVVSLLYARYQAGGKPIAMVSMDNCSHNGDRLKEVVTAFARKWAVNGTVPADFEEYVNDGRRVSFPWTMIDKITPRPDSSVEALLKADGLDLVPVITSRNTYVAPFVNAEESEYLVIEDDFPNVRPKLEAAGFFFADRETVDKVEKMKVCTCLNPLHTALAVFGCLLGYTRISEEMQDADLRKLVTIIGYQEGLPAVADPGIIDPKEFIDTVVNVRFPNPFMPDTPQRIATDTSQKLSVRYGETVKAYLASDKLDVQDLKLIPLVYAGWLRYLLGIDDQGRGFEVSPDPLLEEARSYLEGLSLGEYSLPQLREKLLPLLKNRQIFGVDLEEAGLSERTISYFRELLIREGSVRTALHELVRD